MPLVQIFNFRILSVTKGVWSPVSKELPLQYSINKYPPPHPYPHPRKTVEISFLATMLIHKGII